jgi:hypothetical protein
MTLSFCVRLGHQTSLILLYVVVFLFRHLKPVYPIFIPSCIPFYTTCSSYCLVGDGLRLGISNFTLFIAIQHLKFPHNKILKKNIVFFLWKHVTYSSTDVSKCAVIVIFLLCCYVQNTIILSARKFSERRSNSTACRCGVSVNCTLNYIPESKKIWRCQVRYSLITGSSFLFPYMWAVIGHNLALVVYNYVLLKSYFYRLFSTFF